VNIYVGNLPYKITDADLRELFAAYGEVSSVSMVKDKMTGQSKGFGFVEMPNAAEASAAIQGLNEKAVQGRNIKVNEAKPREDRPRGGDRGGFKPRTDGGGFRPRTDGGFGGGRSDGGAGRNDRSGDRGGFRKREY
jgi:RNA recognition motif-containing protein